MTPFPVPTNTRVCVADERGRKRQLGFVACPRCRQDLFVYMDAPLPAGCCFCGAGMQHAGSPASVPVERDTFNSEAIEPASSEAAK